MYIYTLYGRKMQEEISFNMNNNYNVNIEIKRSRRKTMSLEITYEGRVIVRAPYNMPTVTIKRFVESKSDWINQKLEIMEKYAQNGSETQRLTDRELRELADKALKVLPDKAEYYAQIVGVSYGRITIRHQKTRWGSCSSKGNLNFNCLLMLMPEKIQDYVVVHELCHRKEMNHSAGFWDEVEKVLPDYKERRKWLKENGNRFMK